MVCVCVCVCAGPRAHACARVSLSLWSLSEWSVLLGVLAFGDSPFLAKVVY